MDIQTTPKPLYSNPRANPLWIPLKGILKYIFLVCTGALFLLPFFWMVVSAFRPIAEFYKFPLPLIPAQPTLENFSKLFEQSLFMRGMMNSFFLAAVSVVSQVFFCALAGYAFAKMEFKGREALFIGVLGTMMLPQIVTILPNFIIMARVHLVDTYWPLILPGIANAFGIFWMRQYCQSIPTELLDAARIDGASEFKIFLQIVLPVIQPGIASLAIFVFLGSWTDFLGPLIFLRTDTLYTIQLWLSYVSRAVHVFQPNVLMAGSLLASIPIIILFVTLQRYFISGLTSGSIK